MLFLGAGDSGKSTLWNHLKYIHRTPSTVPYEEKRSFAIRQQIHTDMIVGMQKLLLLAKHEACSAKLGMVLQPTSQQAADTLNAALPKKSRPHSVPYFDLTPQLVICIEQLWKDPIIRASWSQRIELRPLLGVDVTFEEVLYDSLESYFDSTARIMEDTYVPDLMDMLRCRLISTGFDETTITVDGTRFKLLDVGGMRSERRK